MFEKRAPKDFGTYKVDCRNSESACNNACYYIRCLAAQDPDANKIVFIGPNGNNGEDATNRVESGCQVNNPKEASPSVCGNFPFSQKFSNPTAGPGDNYQCDEWPPAMHQQPAFGKKKYPNSLRCMPGGENGSLGSKLMQYVNNKAGPHPGRPAGVMSMGDFFRVDFLSNIASADQKKVKFCLGIGTTNCGQDGMQFGLVAKPVGGGKISAPFNLNKNDNLYALQGTVYKEIYQCSVEFKRDGDKNIKDVKLLNWENSESQTTTGCTLANNGDTCDLKGLPNDLQIKRTGALGSKIEFEYAPGTQNTNVNNFAWDSETSGNGRGPWTDPASDPNRKPNRYCKVTRTGNTENTQCWFPCYKNRDGR
ncbi:hypothetical protein GQ43DRAFT_414083 [Delitschia confertaspora ATCC 74209]|uniref:Uncharacterized protein n=1 Tax=Delitschia confertaspora ATCC 74209 TaxID=1513339 RepID=A0A9P4JQ19_9PLEO|nr:hypothetical protein GQ43DRAFT_414083 [Delitschia confertaspora ATCC 74209]